MPTLSLVDDDYVLYVLPITAEGSKHTYTHTHTENFGDFGGIDVHTRLYRRVYVYAYRIRWPTSLCRCVFFHHYRCRENERDKCTCISVRSYGEDDD